MSQKTLARMRQILAVLLGLSLLVLAACGKIESIPGNRTKEEYQAEQNFKRFFDFLASEKKDFSDVERYRFSVSHYASGEDFYNMTDYTIDLTMNDSRKMAGHYIVKQGDKERIPD